MILALAIRLSLHRLAGSGLIGSSGAAAMNLASYALLLVAATLNIEAFPGLGWILIGVAANGWVIFINGGKMPISPSALAVLGLDRTPEYAQLISGASYTHKLAAADTKLRFLGDIIPLWLPFTQPVAASLGDIAICIGGFILIQRLMLDTKSKWGSEK
ncbi:MAG TPA: DUF5317 domain-containing protein [Firmicutes bacterium]|nr:DUF5317 domain-containing protein [Bacillota bacterium]